MNLYFLQDDNKYSVKINMLYHNNYDGFSLVFKFAFSFVQKKGKCQKLNVFIALW